MRTKDIPVLVFCIIIIGVSVYFSVQLLFPQSKVKTEGVQVDVPEIPETFDETTYKTITNLSDYGKPALDGLGKADLFGGF